jgi:hypothetical protein
MTHRPDDRGSTDLWNVGKLIPVYMAVRTTNQHSKRPDVPLTRNILKYRQGARRWFLPTLKSVLLNRGHNLAWTRKRNRYKSSHCTERRLGSRLQKRSRSSGKNSQVPEQSGTSPNITSETLNVAAELSSLRPRNWKVRSYKLGQETGSPVHFVVFLSPSRLPSG